MSLKSCSGLLPLLRTRLARWSIVVLTGAPQTGKTTLVRDLLPEPTSPRPVYFSLDDPDERLRLAVDPVRRLDHGNRLVILDEVQKLAGLLSQWGQALIICYLDIAPSGLVDPSRGQLVGN